MADTIAAGDAGQSTAAGYEPFGARSSADETRQAQQTNSNDTPTDANYNAVACRAQVETTVMMGKNFEASANRANNAFNILTQILLGEYAGKPKV